MTGDWRYHYQAQRRQAQRHRAQGGDVLSSSELVQPMKTMSSTPLVLPINDNASVASSSNGIDDPDFDVDPESVDFEPLLVSGTGKILSYHSEHHTLSYHSETSYDEEESTVDASTVATSASAATRVATNTNSKRRRRGMRNNGTNSTDDSWSFPQMVRIAGVLSLATFVSIRMFSRPSPINYQMQTKVAKSKPDGHKLSEALIGSSYASNRPLFDAIKSNNIDLTRMLLSGVSKNSKETNNNYDVNVEDPKGITPLIEATLIGNTELVKLLLSHGARAQPLQGFLHTPLRAACLTANLELIQLLLDEGADPNAQSEGGRTPLMGACYLRPEFDSLPNREDLSLAAVKLMLTDPRTTPEIRNSFGESALDLCRLRNYDKSVALLRRLLYERGQKLRESYRKKDD